MADPHEYNMSGVKVKFPHKAYPSQVAMMSKIVTSLQRGQNSLLESPTGSGKSLALLCAALAWQAQEQEKCDDFNNLLQQATEHQSSELRDALMAQYPDAEMAEAEAGPILPSATTKRMENEAVRQALSKTGGFMADPDDGDFLSGSGVESAAYHLPGNHQPLPGGPPTNNQPLSMPKRKKCPRIYFGTRTHKQVSQIVRELRKTAYSGVRMSILGSREHTCIHPTISKSFNKNQDCNDLRDPRKGGGCRFQYEVKRRLSSHHSLRSYMGHGEAWDLEDLVKVGKKVKACPYYASRELKNSAQLIICPYNYLIEPKIRQSMEISLKGQILVLDEAHNIEDTARDAASITLEIEEVVAAMNDCEKLATQQVLPLVHNGLARFCSNVCRWMQQTANEGPYFEGNYTDGKISSKKWTGTEALALWNTTVFDPDPYEGVKRMLDEAVNEQNAVKEEEENNIPVLAKKTTDLLAGIFSALEFMHRKGAVFRDDFRMTIVREQKRQAKGPARGKNGWVGKGDKDVMGNTITLSFACLNPAVTFDDLKEEVRAIVLTSGTLSPMATFATELDVRFPINLEANHVVDKSQVWVASLGRGLKNYSLNAAYQNAQTLLFQDEVGEMVVSVCGKVQHGVLLFFPSYSMLNNMVARWQEKGIYKRLFDIKQIIVEPKFSDQLGTAMKEFYDVIEETTLSPNGLTCHGQTGAIFFAVCRGKVSEGLDFADNNARAVICVGIPFPNARSMLVDLKKQYNDDKKRRGTVGTLSGSEWYQIQAFRALNQALGRCIRHKDDWGAILMVDERYRGNPKYVSSLSKWVRGKLRHFDDCHQMLEDLGQFTTDMKHFMEDRRKENEEKLAARKEVEEKKNMKELLNGDDSDGPGLKAHSKYFDQESSKNREGNSGDTAWTSPRITAKLAAAKEQEAKNKIEEMEKAENLKRRNEKVNANLDNQTHLKNGLDATSLLGGLPPSITSGRGHITKKQSQAYSTSCTSVVSISSSEPSPPKMTILPPKLSKKSKKMDFLSDEEDGDEQVDERSGRPASSRPSLFSTNAKPVTVEAESGKLVEAEPSKPAVNPHASKLREFAFKRQPQLNKQNPTTTSNSSVYSHQSDALKSEPSKRKKPGSPESGAGQPPSKKSSRPWETDQGWLEQPTKDFEAKLKQFRGVPECDFVDLGGLENEFDEDMVEQEPQIEPESEWPEEDLIFDDFVEEPNVTAHPKTSDVLSTPKPGTVSSLQELPSNEVLQTIESDDAKSKDKEFLAFMMKRKQRQEQSPPLKENIPEPITIQDTPEDDFVDIPEEEEGMWGTPQESTELENIEMIEKSPVIERSRPAGTVERHRKPLFGNLALHLGEQRKLDAEPRVEESKDMRRRWSSGEGEDEVVLPEQIKPSLSSEDDIEEPTIEESRVRKKVVKVKRGTQKRPSKPLKATNKTRVSLPVRERNSDDDFL